jgi:hypothetical protein
MDLPEEECGDIVITLKKPRVEKEKKAEWVLVELGTREEGIVYAAFDRTSSPDAPKLVDLLKKWTWEGPISEVFLMQLCGDLEYDEEEFSEAEKEVWAWRRPTWKLMNPDSSKLRGIECVQFFRITKFVD